MNELPVSFTIGFDEYKRRNNDEHLEYVYEKKGTKIHVWYEINSKDVNVIIMSGYFWSSIGYWNKLVKMVRAIGKLYHANRKEEK